MSVDDVGSERCKACDRIFRTTFDKHAGQWEDMCWGCRSSVAAAEASVADYATELELAEKEIGGSLYELDEYTSHFETEGGGFGSLNIFDNFTGE
jgi:hypothetical protein